MSSSNETPARASFRLTEMEVGAIALITGVKAELAADADRLKAMGICEGRRVRLIKKGDPLILGVLGARLGLSARLAGGICATHCPDCP